MKISLNWLQDYLDLQDFSPEQVGVILTDLGLEVEGMAIVESIPGGLNGIVVGEVIECAKHPNADKLSLTKVNVGGEALLPIVCGAPNVAAGQKVLVAMVGTTLYPTSGNSFKIKEAKIRGEVSQGMICAEDEIGLGDAHDGIMVLDPATAVGTQAATHFSIETDHVYDIGLTPNRSDAISHLGVAKDLAAYLRFHKKTEIRLKLPDLTGYAKDDDQLDIKVRVEDLEGSPRYSGVSISNIQIKESPDWLKNRLRSIGENPKNNVVDITNFVMHETGQPLHAFDADEIGGGEVVVKTLATGTEFITLDDQKKKLDEQDVMICDGQGKGMCIAGVYGGLGSGVKDSTKNIFLESAHFHPIRLRKASNRLQLRTEAAIRFEKTTDPNQTVDVLKRAALLLKELAGAHISSEIFDNYPSPIQPVEINLNLPRLQVLTGVNFTGQEVIRLLESMEMGVEQTDAQNLLVKVPTNKADVTRDVDLVEEILRVYGFNNVPISDKLSSTLSYTERPDSHSLRNTVANHLAANGYHEMMGISMVKEAELAALTSLDKKAFVEINNTSNRDLDIMRPSMLVSALQAASFNQNRQQSDIRLFEFGKEYMKAGDSFQETELMTVLLSGNERLENWKVKKNAAVDFHHLKDDVQKIFELLGISGMQISELEREDSFTYGLKLHRGPTVLAELGELSKQMNKSFSLKGAFYFAKLYWQEMLRAGGATMHVKELSKFPTMRRDLALVVNEDLAFSEILRISKGVEKKLIKEINLFDVYRNPEQLGEGKKSYAVSYIFEDINKTLQDKEVDKVMKSIEAKLTQQLGASVRR